MKWRLLVVLVLLLYPHMTQAHDQPPPCDSSKESKVYANITDIEGNLLSHHAIKNAEDSYCSERYLFNTYQINSKSAGFIDEQNSLQIIDFQGESTTNYIPNRTHYGGNNYVIRTNQNNMLLVDEDILSNYTSIRFHVQTINSDQYFTHELSAQQMHGFGASRTISNSNSANSTIVQFYDAGITSDRTVYLLFKEFSKLKYPDNNTVEYGENQIVNRIVEVDKDGLISVYDLKNKYHTIHVSPDDEIFLSSKTKTFRFSNDGDITITEIWNNPTNKVSGGYLVGHYRINNREYETPLFKLSSQEEMIYPKHIIGMISNNQVMYLYTQREEIPDENVGMLSFNSLLFWTSLITICSVVRRRNFNGRSSLRQ